MKRLYVLLAILSLAVPTVNAANGQFGAPVSVFLGNLQTDLFASGQVWRTDDTNGHFRFCVNREGVQLNTTSQFSFGVGGSSYFYLDSRGRFTDDSTFVAHAFDVNSRIQIRDGIPSWETAGIWYSQLYDGPNPFDPHALVGHGTNVVDRFFVGVKDPSQFAGSGQTFGIWANGNWQFWFTGGGAPFKWTGGDWSVLSDARYKKDIVPFNDGLAIVKRIEPVMYKYNGLAGTPDDGEVHVGVIAQQLARVAPEMVSSQKTMLHPMDLRHQGELRSEQVTEDESIDLLRVDSSELTYLLINTVKQLDEQNQAITKLICADNPTESVCPKSPKGPRFHE